ncbi:MAG: SIMPL domain-containing protein, partial [Lachnospiraceae bacterium]|nr:SIMPL domain-containing protein [Lachnospiraceae bacterium]
SEAYTSQEAYSKIKKDADKVKQYLLNNGISENEIVFDSVDIGRTYKDVYDANGNYVGSEEDGYRLTQGVTITSSNLDNVEKISRDISSLLDQGVELTSDSPEYYYSGLETLKLDLINKAAENAKERIDIMAKNTGASLGKLKNSNLGVFQITAKNSGTSSYSYDGAFDTSSRYKTATITVKLEYDIK